MRPARVGTDPLPALPVVEQGHFREVKTGVLLLPSERVETSPGRRSVVRIDDFWSPAWEKPTAVRADLDHCLPKHLHCGCRRDTGSGPRCGWPPPVPIAAPPATHPWR